MSAASAPPPGYPPTPELDRLKAVSEQSQIIGAFLDWLQCDTDLTICEQVESHRRSDDTLYLPASIGIEELLARYFEIDLAKIESERRTLLD